MTIPQPGEVWLADIPFIPRRVQAETNSLVLWPPDFVAHSLQITTDMRLMRASSGGQTPARLSLILNAPWNYERRGLKTASGFGALDGRRRCGGGGGNFGAATFHDGCSLAKLGRRWFARGVHR